MTKRYLVFAGYNYYPIGGWEDFYGAFETVEEAKDALLKEKSYYREWWHIVDLEINQIVEIHYGLK